MFRCKTLFFNSLTFFISVVILQSHGDELFLTVFLLAFGLYVIGFFKVENRTSELKLSISETLVYSFLGRLFDRVLVREVSISFEVAYLLLMIGVFYSLVAFNTNSEVVLIVSIFFPPFLTNIFTKLGYFKFYDA